MAIQPSARIYIQVRETGEVIDVERYVSVTTVSQLDGTATAGIKIVNKADRWYTFRSRAEKKQTDLAQFLKEAYNKNRIVDLNRKVVELQKQARSLSNASQREKKLLEIYSMEQALLFAMGYRVWIDLRGRKDLIDLQEPNARRMAQLPDRWYSAFTGIVSNLEETMKVGKDQSITLQCKDMRRFFETTKISTDLGFKPVIRTIADAQTSLSAYANSFSQFTDGANIVRFSTDLVNRTFHTDSASIYKEDRFWILPENLQMQGQDSSAYAQTVKREYLGYSNRRPLKGFSDSYSETTATLLVPIPDLLSSGLQLSKAKKSDLMKYIKKGDVDKDTEYRISKFGTDVMIGIESDQAKMNPYQQVIKGGFNWETTRVDANVILKAVAGLTGYNIYFDTKGNLVYQKCRYDDFPGVDGDYDDEKQSVGLPFIDEKGEYDASLQSKYGMKYHGRNYLIGDESLMGWTIRQSEDGLVTNVVSQPSWDLTGGVDEGLNSFLMGVAVASPQVLGFAGTRIYQTPAIISKGFSKELPQFFADGILRRMNSNFENCSVELAVRPDLQVARTMYLMERRRLYYITKIQNVLVWGRDHKTVVEGAYGHHPLDPIGDPWRIAMINGTSKTVAETIANANSLREALEAKSERYKMLTRAD